jgi:hypothetical protein
LYTKTSTSDYLRRVAESILQQQIEQLENYVSLRVNETTWWVIGSAPRKERGVLPSFSRIRTVTVDDNQKMHCSCGFIDRIGIPDRHIAHVATKFGVDWDSFTHHDVDIRFHHSYCRYIATADDTAPITEEVMSIRDQLLRARAGPFIAPTAPILKDYHCCNYAIGTNSDDMFNWLSRSEAMLFFEEHGTTTAVLNYSLQDVEFARKAVEVSGQAAGMTQRYFNCEGGDEEDFITFPIVDNEYGITKPLTTYELLNPLFKEICQLFDGMGDSKVAEAERVLKSLINLGKEYRAAELSQQPTGQIISCIPANKKSVTKHRKQTKCKCEVRGLLQVSASNFSRDFFLSLHLLSTRTFRVGIHQMLQIWE